MGKIKDGILGSVVGPVGPVIGATWKGKAVVKSRPLVVSNPNTPAQKAARLKFGIASKFAYNVQPMIMEGLKSLATDITQVNVCVRHMLQNAIVGTYPDYVINFNDVLLSYGEFEQLAITNCLHDDRYLVVEWEPVGVGQLATAEDEISFVLYCKSLSQAICHVNMYVRRDGRCKISFPKSWIGLDIFVYCSVKSKTTGDFCMSELIYTFCP